MGRFEKIFGILFLIALIFKIASIPGGSVMLTIALSSFACFYFFFGIAIFNKIGQENIFDKKSYKGISTLRIIGSFCAGWGLSVFCIGILFNIMQFPGEKIILLVGSITISIVAIIALVRFLQSKTDFYKTILLRIAIIGGLGLFSLLIASDFFTIIRT